MKRSEQRALPSTEAVECHGHRNRHVNTDHADLDVCAEIPRGVAITGKDRGSVAVLVRVNQIQGFFVAVDPDDR